MSHLDFIKKIQYKIQPNQFHTILLYIRGTERQIILFYRPGEVEQVPQVPRMQGKLVGYGSKLSATLGSDFATKIPSCMNPARRPRADQSLTCVGLFYPRAVKGTGEERQIKVYGPAAC